MEYCRFETRELLASLMMSTSLWSHSWNSCVAANCSKSVHIHHFAGITYVALPAVPVSQLGELVDLDVAGDGIFSGLSNSLDSDESLPMVDASILTLFLQLKEKQVEERSKQIGSSKKDKRKKAGLRAKILPHEVYFKEILDGRMTVEEVKNIMIEEERVARPLKKLAKRSDPGRFAISCELNGFEMQNSLCDSGSCSNIMSRAVANMIGAGPLKPCGISFQFADSSRAKPDGVWENASVILGGCEIATDFYILDMERQPSSALLLGRPFLASVGAVFDLPRNRIVFTYISRNFFFTPTGGEESGDDLSSIDIVQTSSDSVSGEENLVRKRKARRGKKKRKVVGNAEGQAEPKATLVDSQDQAAAAKELEGPAAIKNDSNVREIIGGNTLDPGPETNKKKRKARRGKKKKKEPTLDTLMVEPEVKKKEHLIPETSAEGLSAAPKKKRRKKRKPQGTVLREPTGAIARGPIVKLTPMRGDEECIEYKVWSTSKAKPFHKVLGMLTPEWKAKGKDGLYTLMNRIISFRLPIDPEPDPQSDAGMETTAPPSTTS